jgi:hypothetical protein
MPRITYLLLLSFFLSYNLMAQEITGTVADRSSQVKLEHVEVRNGNSNIKAYTDAKGGFKIRASVKDLLIFNQPGYRPDTLLLTNKNPVKRYLILNNNLLKIVEIKSGSFNPEVEYADVYRKANALKIAPNHPFTFYPSKFFSKEGRDARRFKRILEKEKTERKIDLRFNEAAVTALTPLKGQELDYFMVLYRPTLKELDKLDDEEMKFYLMNSFKEFKNLPPNKKISPSLHLN